MKSNLPVIITTGDFNGIGPEIIVKALAKLSLSPDSIIIAGNSAVFGDKLSEYKFINVPSAKPEPGKETAQSGEFSYQCLKEACSLAMQGHVRGIVTAPVSKNALHLAGHFFSGQTEVIESFLAEKGQKAEMLFVSSDFRVLLLTRHIALKDVKITKDLIIEKIMRINEVLKKDFFIKAPKLALCSVNPHAGENGILGNEEKDEFSAAIESLKSNNVHISEPLPADTLFVQAAKSIYNRTEQPYDCYIACYHDQGLIPMKVLAMDNAVNMTVGLNVVRTSPAHGTAFDIAGKGIADESSMIAAIRQFF